MKKKSEQPLICVGPKIEKETHQYLKHNFKTANEGARTAVELFPEVRSYFLNQVKHKFNYQFDDLVRKELEKRKLKLYALKDDEVNEIMQKCVEKVKIDKDQIRNVLKNMSKLEMVFYIDYCSSADNEEHLFL